MSLPIRNIAPAAETLFVLLCRAAEADNYLEA